MGSVCGALGIKKLVMAGEFVKLGEANAVVLKGAKNSDPTRWERYSNDLLRMIYFVVIFTINNHKQIQE